MHCGREGIVWELRIGKEKEKEKKKFIGLYCTCNIVNLRYKHIKCNKCSTYL